MRGTSSEQRALCAGPRVDGGRWIDLDNLLFFALDGGWIRGLALRGDGVPGAPGAAPPLVCRASMALSEAPLAGVCRNIDIVTDFTWEIEFAEHGTPAY